jgi:serine/threonine-protein phosphatase 2A regulatory subunit B
VSIIEHRNSPVHCLIRGVSSEQSKSQPQRRGEYNVYSTFQSHEPEFDYLKSLEIEEKINKIRWLPQQNAAYFLLSTNGEQG